MKHSNQQMKLTKKSETPNKTKHQQLVFKDFNHTQSLSCFWSNDQY